MIDRAAAQRYAEAYVNVLEKGNRLTAGLGELRLAAQTYGLSKDLQRFLGSPEIGEEDKQRILSRLWSDSIGPEGMTLLALLLKWDRMELLPAVSEEAQAIAELRQGLSRGVVATAHPISSAETEALARAVGALLRRRVVLERHVDPELVGGVRVVVGTAVLDGSVRNRLGEVRRQLLDVKVG